MENNIDKLKMHKTVDYKTERTKWQENVKNDRQKTKTSQQPSNFKQSNGPIILQTFLLER